MSHTAIRIVRSDATRDGRALRQLERRIVYPYGDDQFHIDHGEDPFAFFRGLGEHVQFVALNGEKLVGSVALIKRVTPYGAAWYVADLKTDPTSRNLSVPVGLLRASDQVMDGEPLYAISMNPPRGAANSLVRALLRRAAGMKTVASLGLWTLKYNTFIEYRESITAICGPLQCRSLRGIKDVVMGSTGKPMPLLHIEHGPMGLGTHHVAPQASYDHMLCAPTQSALYNFAQDAWGSPQATATVIARDFEVEDASWILTSQI